MSEERDREAADVWSRGPQREVRWLPPTPDRAPAPVHGPRYEPTDDALRVVLWVFGGLIVIALVTAVSAAMEIQLADRLVSGAAVSAADRDANDTRTDIVAGVGALGLIVGALAWINWFHAAYRNAGALGAERRFGEGWAIGSWFVPILSIWRPKQIANDLWAAGEPGHDPRDPPPLLLWWWLAWLFGGQSGAGVFAFGQEEPTPEELRAYAIIDLGTALLSIAAAVLACLVARRIDARLRARAAGA